MQGRAGLAIPMELGYFVPCSRLYEDAGELGVPCVHSIVPFERAGVYEAASRPACCQREVTVHIR